MKDFYASVWARYRYSLILLRELVITDFKLRYQGSFLGYLWSLLRPLAMFSILYIVFVKFLHASYGTKDTAVYLLTGIVLWNYFAEVTNNGVGAIVGRGDLLRKLNFPKYVIVLAGSFSALINLLLNFIVIAIFMALGHTEPTKYIIFIPFLVAELFVLALAVAFFLSALFVRFRDVSYIWEVVMQAAFYATPILYAISTVGKPALEKAMMINPMAQIIQDARKALLGDDVVTIGTVFHNPAFRLIPIAIVAVVSVVAMTYFRSRSKYFAEEL